MSWLFVACLGLLAADAEHFQKLRLEQEHCYFPSQFVALMGEKQVQQELHLSAEQAAEATRVWKSMIELDRAFRGISGEQQAKQAAEKAMQQAKHWNQQLQQLLTKEQLRRANQIMWQGGGEFAIGSDRELIKELALTGAQVAKMDEIRAKLEAESQALMQSQPLLRDFGERLTALREVAKTELRDILTAEQKTKYKELLGPPFDQSGLGRQEAQESR